MKYLLGKQYSKDDSFKAHARLHQSQFRSETLKVECDYYGNLLKPSDAKRYLNFYPSLNVIEVQKKDIPNIQKGFMQICYAVSIFLFIFLHR